MKKLCLFLCLMFCFGIGNANAEKKCLLYNCDGGDKIHQMDDNSGGQCYYCNNAYAGDHQCRDHSIVGRINYNGEITSLWQCSTTMFNDKWHSYNPGYKCPNSPLDVDPNNIPANSYIVYSLDGGYKTEGFRSGDDTVLKAGSTACAYIKCKEGFTVSADKKRCEALNTKCKKADGSYDVNGGTYAIKCDGSVVGTLKQGGALTSLDHVIQNDSSKCTAKCTPEGWDITLNKEGCKAGYEPNKEFKACEETAGTKAEREKKEREANTRICVNSGGTWNDGTGCTCNKSHMKKRADGKACECESSAYEFNADTHTCDITDLEQLKQNCEKAAKVQAVELIVGMVFPNVSAKTVRICILLMV